MKLPFTRFRSVNGNYDELVVGHNLPVPDPFIKVNERYFELIPHPDPGVTSQFSILEGLYVVELTYPRNNKYYDEEGSLFGYIHGCYDLVDALKENLVREIE